MTRWFTTLLYALMLACAALPVHAAAATVAVVCVDTESQDTDLQAPLSAASADLSPSSNDGNAPEVPELYFEPLPRLALSAQTAEAPPSMAVPLSPHPFLKGPQRPPRAVALPLAA